jgi:hypothetical protein
VEISVDNPTAADVYRIVMGPSAMTREEYIEYLLADGWNPDSVEVEADKLFGARQ